MAKSISTILGIIFLVVGLLGFMAPNLFGMHLTTTHNLVHVISGIIALYFGTRATLEGARSFCIVFGIVYGLLGLAGFLFGGSDNRMLTVIPNQFELGTMDHVVHIILGAMFLVGGLVRQTTTATTTTTRP